MEIGRFLNIFLLISYHLLVRSIVDGTSHTKQVPYQMTKLERLCNEITTCKLQLIWCLAWQTEEYCYTVSHQVTEYETKCVDGWTGPDCDIPICKNCMPGYDCVEPDKCICRTHGGACNSVSCSEEKSCFPGTCIGGMCRCPAAFDGEDCQNILITPTIETCKVTVLRHDGNSIEADCAYEGVSHPEVIINFIDWKKIFMTMEVKQFPYMDIPESSDIPHVKFPVTLGVAYAKFKIFREDSLLTEKYCNIEPATASRYRKCSETEETNSLDLNHGIKIIVTAVSSLGGFKEGSRIHGNMNSYFPIVIFTGSEAERSVIFKIDVEKPVHCSQINCKYSPIQLERDISSGQEIRSTFYGWDDIDSGIKMFNVKVFLMQLSGDDLFETVGKPFIDRDLKQDDPDFNNYVFNCKRPGVHSIELTVYDGAGNSAKARDIFIYTGSTELKTNKTAPIRVDNSHKNNKTGEYWITDERFHKGNKKLKISWGGYFVSTARITDKWSRPVRPWDGEGIDDVSNKNTNNSKGLRTIHEMTELQHGITSYTLEYFVDKNDGGIAMNYTNFKGFLSTEMEHEVDIETSDVGTTIGFLLKAFDVGGQMKEEKINVRIDTTSPHLVNWTFIRNDPDTYTSKVNVAIQDEESGIDTIRFKILQVLDSTHEIMIKSGETEIINRTPPEITSKKISKRNTFEGPCEKNQEDCYCTAYRSCFSLTQVIKIDHCWIDRHVKANNEIILIFEVFNQAGLTSGSKRLKLDNLGELNCRPTNKLTGAQMFAVIFCTLIGLVILTSTLALLTRIYVFKKPPPSLIANANSNFINRIRKTRSEPMTNANELYITADEDIRGKKPDANSRAANNNKEKVKLIDETNPIKYISDDDVQVNDEINKGSSIIISQGFFNDGVTKLPVAIKYLKNGASQKAISSMNHKAESLATLPSHDNIVKIFGLIRSNNGHMIVMERCDINLKSWLANISDVSFAILEDMLSFSVNISRGVEFLHEHNIIHKRLAIRNVLIVKQFNQLVAKLIGFGNKKTDDEEKILVPIKWLAPETISTISNKSPIYTKKSDAWSYGITLWEIYMLGKQQPYSNWANNEAKSKIISGNIMDRPDECPPDIYDKVMLPCWAKNPKDRPNFSDISNIVQNFKKGEDGGQAGYYACDDQDCSMKKLDQSQAYYTDGS